MKKLGRPKTLGTMVQVPLTLSQDTIDMLDKMTITSGFSRVGIIRICIEKCYYELNDLELNNDLNLLYSMLKNDLNN